MATVFCEYIAANKGWADDDSGCDKDVSLGDAQESWASRLII
jgi:hypothetical protein